MGSSSMAAEVLNLLCLEPRKPFPPESFFLSILMHAQSYLWHQKGNEKSKSKHPIKHQFQT